MKLTPAQVKNLMRRGLRFLVDPEPDRTDKDRLIAFLSIAARTVELRSRSVAETSII
jgi:hypothetical protein